MTEGWWALLGVVVGTLGGGLFNFLLENHRFRHEKEMFLLQNRSAEMVKTILSDMLNHRTHIDRSFSALKNAVGGYSDDQIRQFLHEVGARKANRESGEAEWWYLATRQEERIARRQGDA